MRGGSKTGSTIGRVLRLAVVVAAFFHVSHYSMPFEDSYITYRYAENLAGGHGFAYNPGERVEGFTSFGWVVVLAGVQAAGLDVPHVATLLSMLFGLLLVGLTATLAERWLGERGPWAAAPAVLVAANGTLAYYAGTGMETTLFVLLITIALVVLGSGSFMSAVGAAFLFVGAALVRPEGVGYLAVVLAALSFDRDGRKQAIVMAGFFLLLFVPYFAWRWAYFGHPLPNTFYAKASPSLPGFLVGLAQVEEYFTTHLFWAAPVLLVAAAVMRGWERWSRLAAAMILGAVVNVVLVGGDGFAFYRFLLPAVPAGAVAIVGSGRVLGSHGLLDRIRRSVSPQVIGLGLFVLLAALTFHAQHRPRTSLTGERPQSQHERVMGVREINQEYFVVGEWLRTTFEPGTVIATNAAGIVPYVSRLPTIDMLGLNDEHIAHRDITLGKVTLGHEKHDARYVLERRPDIILLGLPVLTDFDIRSTELEAWFAGWWQYLPGDRDMFFDDEFRRSYVPYCVPVAQDMWLTFFLRRE